MKATMTLPVLDFTDVGRRLKSAGGNIRRFADVTSCDYAGYLGGTLSFRLIIEIGDHAYVSICSHELAFRWFGVRASMHANGEEIPCAAWMISDARRSGLDDSPALCIRCLQDCDGDTCPHGDVKVQQVPLDRLTAEIVGWVRFQISHR